VGSAAIAAKEPMAPINRDRRSRRKPFSELVITHSSFVVQSAGALPGRRRYRDSFRL
jgi:hypothetical protein